MNKIKVIDLLNMISKGEEVPKKIIGKDSMGKKEEYIYNNFWYIHIFENPDGEEDYYYMARDIKNLNDEIEIMEEDKKIPEKLKLYAPYPECEDTRFEDVENKINEIIDFLKSKGE